MKVLDLIADFISTICGTVASLLIAYVLLRVFSGLAILGWNVW